MFNKSDKLRKLNNDVGLFDENHAMGQSIEQKIAAAFKWGLDVARGYSYPLKEYDVEIPVNIGTKKPKVKAKDSPEIQMKNALKRKTLWQRKMKRCQNAITKIDKEIKRFNKKLQPG